MGITEEDFLLMRGYVADHCGISLGDEKEALLESRLTVVMATNGCTSIQALHDKAVSDTSMGIRDKILEAMTTNETMWFRDSYPFIALKEILLPQIANQFEQGKREELNIWSTACSTGQEAYSIALTLLEFAKENPKFPLDKVKILGTDVVTPIILLAKAGRFDQFSMSRGIDKQIQADYFNQKGEIWEIHERVKDLVDFKKLNLTDNFPPLPKFGIVFCRNVSLYFSAKAKEKLFEKIHNQMEKSGTIWLGHSETLENENFKKVPLQKGCYYSNEG